MPLAHQGRQETWYDFVRIYPAIDAFRNTIDSLIKTRPLWMCIQNDKLKPRVWRKRVYNSSFHKKFKQAAIPSSPIHKEQNIIPMDGW